MARFVNSLNEGLELGYGLARSKNETAYEKYIREHYGPDVTSHRDPVALARAAAGQVGSSMWGGVKAGAGFLGHAAAGLMGAPQGPSRTTNTGGGIGSDVGAVSGITPSSRLYEGTPGTGAGVSAYNPGSIRQGNQGVLDAISRAEGTVKNGYNEVLGSGAYGRPNKPLTEMTLSEVDNFGRNTLGPRWSAATGRPMSTATGRYQITGTNIRDLAGRWGLNMATTKYTPELQDRMALQILKEQGLTAWEGFKSNPKLKQQAVAALQGRETTSTYGDPQVAQLQRDLNARGANLEVDGIAGPLTRAAQQKYSGTAYASNVQDEGRVPTAGVAGRAPAPVQLAYADTTTASSPAMGATRGVTIRQSPASPYANTTGSSFTSGRGDEGRGVPSPLSALPRRVETVAVDASGYAPVQRGFTPPAPTQNQWSSLQGPYTTGTGGANAIQTPRPPQPRPNYQPAAPLQWSQLQQPYPIQQAPVIAPAVVTAPFVARVPQARPPQPGMQWSQLQQSQQAVPVGGLMQAVRQAVSEAMGNRDGGGSRGAGQSYSGSGGNYSGGNYGGQGGGSINQGVGGAYRNR
jgi:hypothetical protein